MSLIRMQPNCLMLEENCSRNMLILVKISSPAKSAHLPSSVLVPVRPERSLEMDLTWNVFHPPTTFSSLQMHQGLIVLWVRGRLSIWPPAKTYHIARCSHRTGLCLPVLVRRVGQREQEAPKDVTSPRQTACQRESPAPQPERWHQDRHISHLAALSRAKYITVCRKVKQQLQGNVGADCRVMRDRGSKSEAELDVDLRLFTVIIRCYSTIFVIAIIVDGIPPLSN